MISPPEIHTASTLGFLSMDGKSSEDSDGTIFVLYSLSNKSVQSTEREQEWRRQEEVGEAVPAMYRKCTGWKQI